MGEIQKKYKVKRIIIFLVISLVLSLSTEMFILNSNRNVYNDAEFSSIQNKINIIGYDVQGGIFTTLNNDPQLLFTQLNSNISAIEIDFSKPLDYDIHVQIYFSEDGQNLSEQNSIPYDAKKGEKKVILNIPYNNYSMIRVDVGTNIGQSFELADVKICSNNVSYLSKIALNINIINTLILAIIFFVILCFIKRYRTVIFNKNNKILDIIFISFCFIMFTLWAIVQPYNSCPDEFMRYDVIKYIFDYNKLPHGGDPLIINKIWGFSYAFLPYLSGLVSVGFMKIISLFTMNNQALILAARMAVVCFGTLTVYYVMKIADKLFEYEYKWLFTVLVCCLPQFVFLSSYMNNDMLALLSVAITIYYWIEGHEKGWDTKSNIGLAIGVSVCLLSYYNAYAFVLFSIVFFVWSNINNKVNKATIFKKFMLVAMLVFILSGWWFIRNGIMYNGDFLGMRTMNEYSNMYAREDIKPINHMNPFKNGVSVLYMLIEMKWISLSYLSFIGNFGYMTIPLYNWMYKFYTVIIFLGLITFAMRLFYRKDRRDNRFDFYLCMILAGITTISLSIYYSYASGFQPQGRYVIVCLIPLMICITTGIKDMFEFIKKRFKIDDKRIIIVISICCILISIICFSKIILPSYI